MSRLFSGQQKRHLYVASRGVCSVCNCDLPQNWEAHHVEHFSNGGKTAIQNGAALCKACHIELHRRKKRMIKPRAWQVKAIEKFESEKKESFLLEATPGAGKTIFSGLCAKSLLNDGEVSFVVVVVPTTALKGDSDAGFLGDWNKCGVDLTTVLCAGNPAPRDFHGGVITYQQLDNMVSTFRVWQERGQKLFFVFDEIHHASETNVWGNAVAQCGLIASRILCMTGTPFRGDGRKIAFVKYDANDRAIADAAYTYRQAVRDRVCREVLFAHDDGIAEYTLNGELNQVKISEADQKNESAVTSTVFAKHSKWLDTVLTKADTTLDDYRITDVDAGGIVICRPGSNESDDRHLIQVASQMEKITGEKPEVITHDDPDANAKIEAFRKSSRRWICAVRKISEGVDIKRLRVMVMATRPGTELLFRQMVGRVVRVDDQTKKQDATVYMARFQQMKEWADSIEQEAKSGLSDMAPERGSNGDREKTASDFIAISTTHEDGGAVSSMGETFTAQEIKRAEHEKRSDIVLSDTPITIIAHLLRKNGSPIPEEYAGKPKHERKLDLRTEINKLVKRIAFKLNADKPDFKEVWLMVNKHVGVRGIDDLMDNHEIVKMEQVKAILVQSLAKI